MYQEPIKWAPDCTLQADILFLYDQWFYQAGRHATKGEKPLRQPFAFLMTIKTNVKCNNVLLFCRSIRLNDHHQQQKQHQKKKQTKKIRSISKTTTLLVHHTFFVHFLAVLHAVTTSWKRLISRFGRA